MLTPPVLVRRLPIALVTMFGSVAFTAGLAAGVLVDRKTAEPPQPEFVCRIPVARPPMTARVSPRSQTIDLLSPDTYVADGTPDEVIDLELTTQLAVTHIFVNGNGGAHQWDTVLGGDPIPFGRVFGGHRGDATWHLGVRESDAWVTNAQTGALRPLAPGSYHLELIGTGVADGPGPRTVTVMFVDGTTRTTAVSGDER